MTDGDRIADHRVDQVLLVIDIRGGALAVHLYRAISGDGGNDVIGHARQARILRRVRRVADMRSGNGLGGPGAVRILRDIDGGGRAFIRLDGVDAGGIGNSFGSVDQRLNIRHQARRVGSLVIRLDIGQGRDKGAEIFAVRPQPLRSVDELLDQGPLIRRISKIAEGAAGIRDSADLASEVLTVRTANLIEIRLRIAVLEGDEVRVGRKFDLQRFVVIFTAG